MRYIFAFILIIITVSVSGCSFQMSQGEKKQTTSLLNSDFNNLETESNNEMNINNLFGKIKVNNEFIFYITKSGITRLDKSKKEKISILSENDIYDIAIWNDEVYYLIHDSKDNVQIKSVDFSGKHEHVVWMGNEALFNGKPLELDSIWKFDIYNGKLYIWINGICIVEYDQTTKELSEFLPDVSRITFCGSYAYYTVHAERTFSLYSINLNTKKVKMLRGNGKTKESRQNFENEINIDQVIVAGGELYYSTRLPNRIYKYIEDGEDILLKQFSDSEYHYLLEFDDFPYYAVTSYEKDNVRYKIFKIDRKSGESVFVAEVDKSIFKDVMLMLDAIVE